MAQLNFDPTAIPVEPAVDDGGATFEPLPNGWYPVQIIQEEQRPTKANPQNQYLFIEYEVIGAPKYNGRKHFARYNLWNTSAQTVEYAQKDLALICKAVRLAITDTSQLLHQKLEINLYTKDDEKYGPQNEISRGGYRPIQSPAAGQQQGFKDAPAAPAAPAQPAPWN